MAPRTGQVWLNIGLLTLACVIRNGQAAKVIGCYADKLFDRAMKGPSYTSVWNMTPDNCQQFCYSKGYKYAGVEQSQDCYCDNVYNRFGTSYGCNHPCTGDLRQICGGLFALSIVETGYNPDPCSKSPCANDGVCKWAGSGTAYTCICPVSYTGLNCQTYIDPCSSGPCANGGVCKSAGAAYACTCSSLYTGDNCQTLIDPCAAGPCSNGGQCVANGARFTCKCPPGWSGLYCTIYVDPCSSGPCANGGVCKSSGAAYSCACAAQYTGSNCQTYVDPCSSGPCANGGVCKSSGAAYSCACPAQYTGTNCQTYIDPCGSGPCANGGQCTSSGASFTCQCPSGWTGSDCTTSNNYCVINGNPCQNGGECEMYGDSYQCHCQPGFAGINCELDVNACKAVADNQRLNCGWGGVTMAQCNARSCCYDATAPSRGAASCFYSQSQCAGVNVADRVDCYKIPQMNQKICNGYGCCWDSTPGAPLQCYRQAAMVACLNVPAERRAPRKNPAGTPNDCEANGSCWDSSIRSNSSLWCFDVIKG